MPKDIRVAEQKVACWFLLVTFLLLVATCAGRALSPDNQTRLAYSINLLVGLISAGYAIRWCFETRSKSVEATCYVASLPAAASAYFFYNSPFLGNFRWKFGAIAFFCFGLTTLIALLKRFSPTLRDYGIGRWVSSFAFFCSVLWLQFEFVIAPLRNSSTALVGATLFFYLGYRVLFSAILVLAVFLSSRVKHGLDAAYLLSLIVLHASGFGWVYQFASKRITILNWTWQIWALSTLSLLAVLIVSSYSATGPLQSRPALSERLSVRSSLACTIFLGVIFIVVGMIISGVVHIHDGLYVSSVLGLAAAVWIFANCVALFVSRQLEAVRTEMVANSERKQDLATVGERRQMLPLAELHSWIIEHNKIILRANSLTQRLMTADREAALVRLAAQVAHDIRSPLAAINMVMPAVRTDCVETKALLDAAVDRIRNISDDLLAQQRHPERDEKGKALQADPFLFVDAVSKVVAEKRIQLKDSSVKITISHGDQFCQAFVQADRSLFQRVVSNILNNAVEAAAPKERGEVTVAFHYMKDAIACSIADNGPGIPEGILGRLGDYRTTQGKANGNGLGLYHAIKALDKMGGELKIANNPSSGATVSILMNHVSSPSWFPKNINLSTIEKVLVLDDDPCMHAIWKGRFASFDVEITCASNEQDLVQILGCGPCLEGSLFLIDHDLLGSGRTGIEIIEAMGLSEHSILVTGRHDDPSVMARCRALCIPILPKLAMPHIPVLGKGPQGLFGEI